jgi:hypothetical protein
LAWILGATSSPCSKFHPSSKFKEEILLNSKPRRFSNFSFEIHSKSEEVSMEKVVHLFEIFTTICFPNFWSSGRSILDQSKFE